MKDGWFCIMVFWQTGEVQSIWVKGEKLAAILQKRIIDLEGWEKIKLFPEEEKDENTKR